MTIHVPKNEDRIDTVYAYLSIDEEGKNGIVAHIVENLGSTPLVTSKRRIAEKMKPIAELCAKETGKHIGLFVFDRRDGLPLWDCKP
jgi:hypothetical protein